MDGDVRARLLSDDLITVEPTRLDHPETEALVAELIADLGDRYGDENVLHDLVVPEFAGAAGGRAPRARVGDAPPGFAAGLRTVLGAPPGGAARVPQPRRSATPTGSARTVRSPAPPGGAPAELARRRTPAAHHGYERISDFGPWVDQTLSVCLEKRLT